MHCSPWTPELRVTDVNEQTVRTVGRSREELVGSPFHAMKLLIVDDNPINLKVLHAQLEAEGHAVLDAADASRRFACWSANQ